MTKILRIDFRNFWPAFRTDNSDVYFDFINTFFLKNHIELKIDKNKPDIIFYSVFGKPDLDQKCSKILFTRENLYAHQYSITHLPYIHQFDFVLGFEDNNVNHYKIPYYYIVNKLYNQTLSNHYNFIKENNTKQYLINKNKKICLISHNPHKLRLDLIYKFKNQNLIVDCPGKVGNNMVMTQDNDKQKFLLQYHFNICPENSWSSGYTTEKLYDSLIAGCIPIYWGCDKFDNNFYNKNKILSINKDSSNIDNIINLVFRLVNHKNELIYYSSLNPFSNDRLDIIHKNERKIINVFKKIIDSI